MVIGRLTQLVLLFLVLSSAALAVDFDVEFTPGQQNIKLDETATFGITLKNFGPERTFEIYSPDVEWDVVTDPTEDRLLTVNERGSKSTRIVVTPLYVTPGYYFLPIHVRPIGTNEVIKENVLVGVNSLEPPVRDYEPAVRVTTDIPDEIDPREPVEVTVDLDNRNRRDHEEIRVKVRSDLLNKEYTTNLPPLERKSLKFKLFIDPLTSPQEEVVYVSATVLGGERPYHFDAEPRLVEISEYGAVESLVQTEKRFLKSIDTITLSNNANVENLYVHRVERSALGRLFGSAVPEPRTVTTNEGTFWEWEFFFQLDEERTIEVMTNYRPILWILLLIILAIVGYFVLRSPVVVKKSAMILEKREGGISELKVLIELKNRSHRAVKDVTLIDKVPAMVNILKKFEMGTLEPTKIAGDGAGNTLVKWTLTELDSFEERVLTYKIRSKFSILGSLNLPLCVCKFHSTAGTKRSTRSNITQIGFGN